MSAVDEFKLALTGNPMLPGTQPPAELLGWPDPLTLKTILELIARVEALENKL